VHRGEDSGGDQEEALCKFILIFNPTANNKRIVASRKGEWQKEEFVIGQGKKTM